MRRFRAPDSESEEPSGSDSSGRPQDSEYSQSEAPSDSDSHEVPSDSESEEESPHRPAMMKPKDIYYIQDSIANRFQCGRSLLDTTIELESGDVCPSDIPTIRIFRWRRKWHTADNRRLWCFRAAGLRRIPVRYIHRSEVDPDKFTTENGGESVVMR